MQQKLDRRNFLKQASLSVSPLLIQAAGVPRPALAQNSANKPNVILIMTDDQGYGDFGVTGNPVIQTPNLDAMSKRSASMENFYVCPVCAPTRACLMTGRYNYRTRVVDTWVGRAMMEPEEVTIAEILQKNGYATGIFGKWHLGDCYPMRPNAQGFDKSLVIRGGGIGQPSDPPGGEGKYTDPILFDNGKEVKTKGYCTDVFFDEALKWAQENHKNNKPFFAYIPTNAPHSPFHDVPEKWYEYYKSRDISNKNYPQDKGNPLPQKEDLDRRARLYAMISNIDDNVGKLFASLNQMGITNDTLVIFLSDNGPIAGRYNAGFKGSKTGVHEGGIRTPLFVHWPGKLKPGVASDRIAAHIDLMPTILDACNISKPQGWKLDGKSILPLLQRKKVDWKDRTLFIQTHRGDTPVLYHHFAARSQNWKLLHASGFGKETFEGEPKFELYDMKNDPYEMNDLSNQQPAIVDKMRKQYEDWFRDVSSTRPGNYAPPRIHIGTSYENPVVLTREDWRHVKGRTWAPDSNGYWLLYAPRYESYDIRLRFPVQNTKWKIKLEINDKTQHRMVEENSSECLFEWVSIEKGNVKLMVTMTSEGKSQGPWQVDVIKK